MARLFRNGSPLPGWVRACAIASMTEVKGVRSFGMPAGGYLRAATWVIFMCGFVFFCNQTLGTLERTGPFGVQTLSLTRSLQMPVIPLEDARKHVDVGGPAQR